MKTASIIDPILSYVELQNSYGHIPSVTLSVASKYLMNAGANLRENLNIRQANSTSEPSNQPRSREHHQERPNPLPSPASGFSRYRAPQDWGEAEQPISRSQGSPFPCKHTLKKEL